MRTPKGYLKFPAILQGCNCTTEAERLMCCARWLEEDTGSPLSQESLDGFPYDDPYIPFNTWMNGLAISLWLAAPVVRFCAIMENWPRGRILAVLRRRGETRL